MDSSVGTTKRVAPNVICMCDAIKQRSEETKEKVPNNIDVPHKTGSGIFTLI